MLNFQGSIKFLCGKMRLIGIEHAFPLYKTYCRILPVSRSTCKAVGSHLSCPHNKKKNKQTENPPVSFEPSENWEDHNHQIGEIGKHSELQLTGSRSHCWRLIGTCRG